MTWLPTLALIAVVFGGLQAGIGGITWLERRVAGWIQDRLGPNRVGPEGILQPLADGIKHMWKEEVIPKNAHTVLYIAAPIVILIPALSTFAVIPFGSALPIGDGLPLIIADINSGLLYVLALSSLTVYGILLAGWASGSKFSLLGGLRAASQVISYELPLRLSIVGVILSAGSLRLLDIVADQGTNLFAWNCFLQWPGFLVFLVTIFAETNRLPFDLPEAEQELVAGYHTEYSSIKFLAFYMAEYAHMFTGAALMTLFFLGGWHLPFLAPPAEPSWLGALLHVGVFTGQVMAIMFLFIWVRWTLPRFRYDQLMRIGWKVMLPIAVANLCWVAVWIALRDGWFTVG